MFLVAATAATLILSQQSVDKPTLELYQQRFVLRTPSELIRVPLNEAEDLLPAVMYRRDEAYAVWDERGLTIRKDDWSFSTRVPEIPTSPKVFKRAEILETLRRIDRGQRSLGASAMSGSMRIGNNAYFLLRWDDADGEPWHESLVAIDLSLPRPKPRLVGTFNGMTLSRSQIDNQMFILDGKLTAVTRTFDTWGTASYDVEQENFAFRQLGTRLSEFWRKPDLTGYFVERSQGAGSLAGEVVLKTGARREIWNNAGLASFVDAQKPELLTSTGLKGQIYWPETGSVREVPAGSTVKRAGKYVIVWMPPQAPTQAFAYEPAGWREIARWTSPTR